MAHETAHIAHRDPLDSVFRGLGLRLAGSALGVNPGLGDVSPLAAHWVDLSYHRAMEARADASGVEYLRASGLRSDGLAGFFGLMAQREGAAGAGAVAAFFSDHPPTTERQALNQGSAQGQTALSPQQWAAVQHMCDRH
jgi:Zn-dependent protease with chaperone function